MDTEHNPDPPLNTIRIDLEPVGRRVDVALGTSLLEAAQLAGIDLVAVCGGVGICGACRVRPISGECTPISAVEREHLSPADLQMGFRLACQTAALTEMRVEIPPESLSAPQKMQLEGPSAGNFTPHPAVCAVDISVLPPSQTDLRSDLTRVGAVLAERGFSPLVAGPRTIDGLVTALRANDWSARLVLRPAEAETGLVAALTPGRPWLGLAVDLGSTKLAVYLVDLATGVTLAHSGVMNPQISFGEDVVSRIAFADRRPENRDLLQSYLITSVNRAAAELCRQVGAQPDQIVDVVVVGNTAMHHFFCRLPVQQLGAAPYVPAISDAMQFPAHAVGLTAAEGADIYLPPNIAGYVGGDHTAALLAAPPASSDYTSLLIDIGTNTEISLRHAGQIVTCSCASGPAFEGAHIRDGMRAAPGAIEKIAWHAGDIHYSTVGGMAPVGICGSGILQAIAEMQHNGVIDSRGVLARSHLRSVTENGKPAFLLVPAGQTAHGRDIVITRKDIHEIQLAKAAIRVGIDALLAAAQTTPQQVDSWVVAGAFGTYLDLASAVRIGMFPDVPLERFHQVGNAAGAGAKQMLLSRQKRAEAQTIVQQVRYIELTNLPNFMDRFTSALYFPENGG